MDSRISSKLSRFELFFLIVSSVLIMTLVTTSSPIYPFNVWDDTNVYFTLGRGILKGFVPYKDLYEQKGPLFLFLYAISALISNRTFTGLWIIECIFASIFAVFSWKSVKLFITDIPKLAIGMVPVLLSAVYTIGMFNFGGGAEEICFPLLSVVLYTALKTIRSGNNLPDKKDAFVCGIIAGFIFWSKYTLLGFVLSFIVLLIIKSIRIKAFKSLMLDALWFLLGVLFVSLPVFIYFGANGSLGDLYESYFYNNIFRYHNQFEYSGIFANPVFRFFAIPFLSFWFTMKDDPIYLILWLITLLGLICFDRKYKKEIIIMTLFSLIVCLCTIFTNAIYIYYYGYPLCFYFIFALYAAVAAIKVCRVTLRDHVKVIDIITVIVTFFLVFNLLIRCKNYYLLSMKKEDMAQFKFAQIINQTEDPKIFTYDIIDGGFYLAASVDPSNRFFTTMNFIENNTDAVEEQERLIREGYFDFIITIDNYDWDNYELVATSDDLCIDYSKMEYSFRYYLYQRTPANAW